MNLWKRLDLVQMSFSAFNKYIYCCFFLEYMRCSDDGYQNKFGDFKSNILIVQLSVHSDIIVISVSRLKPIHEKNFFNEVS